MKIHTSNECIALINRTAQWCFDQTNNWEYRNIGTGLAYLFWTIASPGKVVPFDATLANTGGRYDELVRILELNPNGLLKHLVDGGFILVDPKIKRRVMKNRGRKWKQDTL
jgi:hypothetical protein